MSYQQSSELERSKLSYYSAGFFIIGTIMFFIGSSLLVIVAKGDLDEKLEVKSSNNHAFPY